MFDHSLNQENKVTLLELAVGQAMNFLWVVSVCGTTLNCIPLGIEK
jgi:hypothetical protein